MLDPTSSIIEKHWTKKAQDVVPERTRWWESELIVEHYNKLVCGRALSGTSAGLISHIKSKFESALPFGNAISVGGSNGWKERLLLKAGVASHFTVAEFSKHLIDEGTKINDDEGLNLGMSFVYGDAFEIFKDEAIFDLVYWDNALHHMMDVEQALLWSRRVLRQGGLLVMNDFVGATRMQFSDEMLHAATLVRQSLDVKYLRSPFGPGTLLERQVRRCDPLALANDDPSECADSARILPSLAKHFPDAEVILTGGAVYHAALSDVLHNFNEADPNDRAILELFLELDRLMALNGMTHYAVAFAKKS